MNDCFLWRGASGEGRAWNRGESSARTVNRESHHLIGCRVRHVKELARGIHGDAVNIKTKPATRHWKWRSSDRRERAARTDRECIDAVGDFVVCIKKGHGRIGNDAKATLIAAYRCRLGGEAGLRVDGERQDGVVACAKEKLRRLRRWGRRRASAG